MYIFSVNHTDAGFTDTALLFLAFYSQISKIILSLYLSCWSSDTGQWADQNWAEQTRLIPNWHVL